MVRSRFNNRPGIVRLNITHTTRNDTGTWMCTISTLASEVYIVHDGRLVDFIARSILISREINNIQVIIVSKLFHIWSQ